MIAPLLIALAWKSALLCVVALAGLWAMRGRPAAERGVLLRVALVALLALPVLTLALPAAELPLLPALEAAAPSELATSLPAQKAVISMRMSPVERPAEPGLAWLLYLGGVGLVLLHLAIGTAMLARWTWGARAVADPRWRAVLADAWTGRRRVRLLVSAQAMMPLSWGIAPAWILLDRDTAARAELAESVIAHELAHIRRFDWLALVAAHLAVALFWFNPLVWLLRQRLGREAELAADSDAVRAIDHADYAQVLLSVAARPVRPSIANGMALTRGGLPHRIATLLEGQAHRRASRTLSGMLLACGLVLTGPLAAMKLVAGVSPGGTEIALRTVLEAPAPAGRRDGLPARKPVPVPGKPPVKAPPVAPPPPPPPVASEPGVLVLSKPGKQLVLLPAPQQVVLSDAEQGRRSAEEGRRQSIESRAEAAANLIDSAADLREQAQDLEAGVDEGDTPAPMRAGQLRSAQALRAQAAKLDSEARAMLGAP